MSSNIPNRVIETIESRNVFCLVGHSDPDGDCLGSQLALANFLRRIGKTAHLYSPGPFGRPEIAELESQFAPRIEKSVIARDPVIIVLDCSSLDRIGAIAEDIQDLSTVIVIDHHSTGEQFGDIRYIDTSAPAVTLLVQNLIETIDHRVDETEAKWILFGLCTDTGFFRHLDSPGRDVFDAIGRLNEAGATPKRIYGMIFGGRSLEAQLLLGKLLARTVSACDNRVLLTYETLEDKRTFGDTSRDSDALYRHLQAVKGCEAIIFIREEGEGSLTVGLRSSNDIDVGAIAQSFGGGGHRRAAGFSWTGERMKIEQKLVQTFSRLFSGATLSS